MTIVSYHSTLIKNLVSKEETPVTTSSQIFLSRGVAGADSSPPQPEPPSAPTFVATIFNNSSRPIMTIGDTAEKTATLELDGGRRHSYLQPSAEDSEEETSMSPNDRANSNQTTTNAVSNQQSNLHDQNHLISDSPLTTEPEDVDVPNQILDNDMDSEIDRGRSRERSPRHPDPLNDAGSRSRRNDWDIKLDVRPIEKRSLSRSNTFYEDPNDPCAQLDDDVLEPCPHISICDSVSEILDPQDSVVSTARNSRGMFRRSFDIRAASPLPVVTQPVRAMTTVFNDCKPLTPDPMTSPKSSSRPMADVNHLEKLAEKVGAPLPNSKMQPKTDALFCLASKLPTEIIQHILCSLSPTDFNAARHTCRSWFISSMNRTLLGTMFKRGGFTKSLLQELAAKTILTRYGKSNNNWLMSKRLSRECALSPDWTGNGLDLSENYCSEFSKKSAFKVTSSVDFTEMAVHYPGPDSASTIFTVSSCGKFLMAANGCLVYIYELNTSRKLDSQRQNMETGGLRPITSIICPRRVLACSMDTSSNRHAIAVLLDGRMGLVCDIKVLNNQSTSTQNNDPTNSFNHANEAQEKTKLRGTSFLDRVSLNSSSSIPGSQRPRGDPPFVFPGIATTSANSAHPDEFEWQDIFNGDMPPSTRTAGPSSRHGSLPRANIVTRESEAEGLDLAVERDSSINFMPVEEGTRSLYRNLCSDDDPPRSVAICPQRRCVAFGCSSGIELHWVDALTGQDLNRWFPLTAPSDFLYFLPPRKSVDSAKKLRLISSAARPNERPAITERHFGGRTRSSPFWEQHGWGSSQYPDSESSRQNQGILTRVRIETGRTSFTGRMDCSDHYRAVPLSDGYHILFTDPATGLLCLGSDAPVGGPTKLLRKIWFAGPDKMGGPCAYAAGSDLSWGVRVVAAFGEGPEQTIWLYSVPLDVFTANETSSTTTSTWFKSNSGTEVQNNEWIDWWPDDGLQEWLRHIESPVPGIIPRSAWPIKVRGQKVGTCNGLVDISIDSGPDMAIWVFNKGGVATVWKLDDGKCGKVKQRWVLRDGTVRENDEEGDIEMSDSLHSTPSTLEPPLPLLPVSFDGSDSFTTSTIITTRSERRHRVEWSQHPVQYDADGDVVMADVPSPGVVQHEEAVEEMVVERRENGFQYELERWLRQSYRGMTSDFDPHLAGIARIDVEIR